MGEHTDDVEELNAEWRALVEHGERYAEFGLSAHSERLREGGPFPAPANRAPLIIDIDIGGDPDDALAVAVAARRVPELALVVTSDERGGDRARFARHLLDQLGRPDVPVVAGAQPGETRHFCVDGLFPADAEVATSDVAAAVDRVLSGTEGPVRWVGMGPATNLAAVLRARPDAVERLRVTQMGGALQYRDPERAEHNFRLDPTAAAEVVATARRLRLVISDVTFRPELEVTASSPVYEGLAVADAPAWARTLREHLDRWFAMFHPGTIQHDPLTLSVALGLPFVDLDLTRVTVASDGRMRADPEGVGVFLSRAADYEAFMRWFTAQLELAESEKTAVRRLLDMDLPDLTLDSIEEMRKPRSD